MMSQENLTIRNKKGQTVACLICYNHTMIMSFRRIIFETGTLHKNLQKMEFLPPVIVIQNTNFQNKHQLAPGNLIS